MGIKPKREDVIMERGQILPAKEFNRRAYMVYREAVERSKYPKGVMPIFSQFGFVNERTGETKAIGYVLKTAKGGYIWQRRKKDLQKVM